MIFPTHGAAATFDMGLAALAVGRRDQATGDGVGDLAAMVAAHEVQAGVDPGRGAGRGARSHLTAPRG